MFNNKASDQLGHFPRTLAVAPGKLTEHLGDVEHLSTAFWDLLGMLLATKLEGQ